MRKLSLLMAILTIIVFSGCSQHENIPDVTINEIFFDAKNVESLSEGKVITGIHQYSDMYYISYVDTNNSYEGIRIYSDSFEYKGELTGEFENLNLVNYKKSVFDIYDNELYFVYMDEGNTLENRHLINYDLSTGKEISRIVLDSPKDIWDGRVLSSVYVDDNRIILVSGVGVQICDRNGKTIKEIYSSDKSVYYINASTVDHNGNLYFSCTEESTPYLYKIAPQTGECIWKVKLTFGNIIRNLCATESSILIQNEYLIQHISFSGDELTTICDIRDYNKTLTAENNSSFYKTIFGIKYNDGELVYIYSDNQSNSDIVKMVPLTGDEKEQAIHDKEVAEATKTEIRVFLPYKDNKIENIIYDFEKDHNAEVVVEYYSDSYLNFNTEDYLQVVGTRIMSGDCGWDIMSTELIPYIQYANKGYFADLYKLKQGETLKDSNRFFTNVLEACGKEESLYILPMSIEFTGAFSNSEVLEQITSFENIIDLCLNSKVKLTYTADMNFAYLFEYLFTEFCVMDHSSVFFDEHKYIGIAEGLRELYYADCYTGKSGFDKNVIQLKNENELTASKDLEAYKSFQLLNNEQGHKLFRVLNGYAIMEKASNKDLALQLLMSIVDTYSSRYTISKANTEKILDNIEDAYMHSPYHKPVEENVTLFREKVFDIISNADQMQYYDTDIYVLAYQLTNSYIKGEIGIDVAVSRIKTAVSMLSQENG